MNAPHLRNLQIQDLIYQNQELRRKLKGYDDLQLYNDELLHKFEVIKTKEIDLVSHNERLKKTIYQLEDQSEKHSEEMKYLLTQHDRIFAEKDSQIDRAESQLDKNKVIISNLQRDIRQQIDAQRQLTSRYDKDMQNYEKQFINCQREITELKRELHIEKSERCKDKQTFNMALKQEEKANYILNEEIDRLTLVIQKLKEDNLLLADYTKELETTITNNDEEHDLQVRKLKNEIEDLYVYGEQSALQKKQLLESSQIITKSLEDAKRREVHLKDQNEELHKKNQKLLSQLQSTDQQLAYCKQKWSTLEDAIRRQSKNFQQNAANLIQENTILTRQIKESQHSYNNTWMELKQSIQTKNDLQSIINKLQSQLNRQQDQLNSIINDLNSCQSQLKYQKDRCSQYQLQTKRLNELIDSLRQETNYLQTLNKRLQNQIQTVTEEKLILLKKAQPKDVNKELMEQINKMMISFKQQREDSAKMNKLEKDKLIQSYEYQLREKDVSYMKQIAKLRDQLNLNEQFEVMREKNCNIYTTNTFKY